MKMMLTLPLFCLIAVQAMAADKLVKVKRIDGIVFLNALDVANTLEYKLETLQDGHLLTFCRGGQGDGVCVPVQLSTSNHRIADGDLYLASADVSAAMQVQIFGEGEHVRLSALPANNAANVPSYNAAWGKGRGFGVGDTLPDIPLMDMDGNEVRFSKFLGRKYILYCWASW
jgi:hypothetical protein